MPTVNSLDLTNFYDFGRANDPANPESSHRMYFDYLSAQGSNKLMITDGAFNITSSYQAWPASLIVLQPGDEKHILRTDICVLNDQGLNSFPPRANQTSPIYRMYLAKRNITVDVPTLVSIISIAYTGATGDFSTEIGLSITNGSGAIGYIASNTPNAAPGSGVLFVYVIEGVFAPGDTVSTFTISALAGDVVVFDDRIIFIETLYKCSLLIVKQNFEIEFIIPLLQGNFPLNTLSSGSICCTYDYGFNAQATDQNYIWHMYVGEYQPEEERPEENCLLIVNQDFKVDCYQISL